MPNWFTLPHIILNALICVSIYALYLLKKPLLREILSRGVVLYGFLLSGLLLIFSNYFTKAITFFGYDGSIFIVILAYIFITLMLLYFVLEKWFYPLLFYAYFATCYYLLEQGHSVMMLPIIFGFALCLAYSIFVTRRIDKARPAK